MDPTVMAPVQALESLGVSTRGKGDVLPFLVWALDHNRLDRGSSKQPIPLNLLGRGQCGKGSKRRISLRWQWVARTISRSATV